MLWKLVILLSTVNYGKKRVKINTVAAGNFCYVARNKIK